jgi:DNA invertase Pin-like site-specific DNA recombinase
MTMPLISKRPAPEWLRPLWEQKRKETAARVQAAVDQLRRRGRRVTVEAIRDAIRSMCGVSISTSTIKRNELAYQIYLANGQKKPRAASLPQPALRELVENASAGERHGLRSKISRLRREPKDALVAKLVSLERAAAKQRDVENRLREEILRLSPGND